MATRLVNVRLDADRLRKARKLREQGLSVSAIVREAIDQRYQQLSARAKAGDVRKIVERILAQYPDPPDLPARGYDVHDRREAAAAIRRQLKKRRR